MAEKFTVQFVDRLQLSGGVPVARAGLATAAAATASEWTFRSTGPSGTGSEALALLAIDYDLPVNTDNRYVGVAADRGHPGRRRDVPGHPAHPAAGQKLSLRVSAAGDAGSVVTQTIVDTCAA